MLNLDHILPRTLIALALSAAPVAAQTTWLVDDDGGPGVHFTGIAAALAVAGPFDLIDVRAGQYGPFSVVRPARILGAPGASVTGTSTVVGLPAGTWSFIAELALERLQAFSLDGTLVLDGLTLSGNGTALSFGSCDDVRGHRLRAVVPWQSDLNSDPKVRVNGGRVQLTDRQIVEGVAAGERGDGLQRVLGARGHVPDAGSLHVHGLALEGHTRPRAASAPQRGVPLARPHRADEGLDLVLD